VMTKIEVLRRYLGKKKFEKDLSDGYWWNVSLFGGSVQWPLWNEIRLWELAELRLILAYLRYGLSLIILSFPSVSSILGHFHQHQREGRGNEERDAIQMNQFCHLLAAQLTSVQGGGGCSSSVGFNSPCYSCPLCCQAISSGLYGNDL
jgi:hypothetical protein